VIALLWTGCFGLVPFRNEGPVLLSVNGVEPVPAPDLPGVDGLVTIEDPIEDNSVLTLEIEVEDPEGDAVRIWFPASPYRFDFDPDERTGLLFVEDGLPNFDLVLQDDAPNPGWSDYVIHFLSSTTALYP
jgi:hypothetical protein